MGFSSVPEGGPGTGSSAALVEVRFDREPVPSRPTARDGWNRNGRPRDHVLRDGTYEKGRSVLSRTLDLRSCSFPSLRSLEQTCGNASIRKVAGILPSIHDYDEHCQVKHCYGTLSFIPLSEPMVMDLWYNAELEAFVSSRIAIVA